MDLELILKALHDELVRVYGTSMILRAWVTLHVPDKNVEDIITEPGFSSQVLELLKWMESEGRVDELLQALADDPPHGDTDLPLLIHAWTRGTIKPASSELSGLPPIEPVKDWFVTQRPFANREKLRDELASLAKAKPGPESVLVIEGPRHSGKSMSINFAAYCAPRQRVVTVDFDFWGKNLVYANELAGALDPSASGVPEIDQTKEDAAVPQLLIGLRGKLKDSNTWIIIDHCNRPNLTNASETLLMLLAEVIERGFLPGVRLIVADYERAKLPGALKSRSRYDYAQLPNRDHVKKWCTSLADHMSKTYSDDDITTYVEEIFAGMPPVIADPGLAAELEDRLRAAFDRLQQLGG